MTCLIEFKIKMCECVLCGVIAYSGKTDNVLTGIFLGIWRLISSPARVVAFSMDHTVEWLGEGRQITFDLPCSPYRWNVIPTFIVRFFILSYFFFEVVCIECNKRA